MVQNMAIQDFRCLEFFDEQLLKNCFASSLSMSARANGAVDPMWVEVRREVFLQYSNVFTYLVGNYHLGEPDCEGAQRMANTFIGTSMPMCLLQVPCVDVSFPGDFVCQV